MLKAGFQAKWLNLYCPACQVATQEESRKFQADAMAERERLAAEDRRKHLIEKRIKALRGVRAYRRFTFDQFDPNLNATHKFLQFMMKFPIEAKNLFLYGPTGTGKTHLGSAKIRTLWEKNPPGSVRRIKAADLKSIVRHNDAGQLNNAYEREYALRNLAKVNALMIDELDKKVDNETNELIHELLDLRDENDRFGLILVANVDVDNIASVMGLPIADRINAKTFELFEIPPETPSVRGDIDE